eukprot:2825078-Prymnesium_polylepis.2
MKHAVSPKWLAAASSWSCAMRCGEAYRVRWEHSVPAVTGTTTELCRTTIQRTARCRYGWIDIITTSDARLARTAMTRRLNALLSSTSNGSEAQCALRNRRQRAVLPTVGVHVPVSSVRLASSTTSQ